MKAPCLLIFNMSSLYIHLVLMEFLRVGLMQAPSQIIYLIFRLLTISQYVEVIVCNSSSQEG